MLRKKILLILPLILFLFLISCETITNKTIIIVKGSQSMSYVFEQIAESYNTSVRSPDEEVNLPQSIYDPNPNKTNEVYIPEFDRSQIEFIFLDGNSSRGIASLLDGNEYGEIILSTRDLTLEEIRIIENNNRTYIGDVLHVFKYAEDSIVPITSNQNPRNIILDPQSELRAILQGRQNDWLSVKPFMPINEFVSKNGVVIQTQMQIAIREEQSAIIHILKTKTTSGVLAEDIVEISNDMNILQYVSKIYNSFSMMSSTYRGLFENMSIKELDMLVQPEADISNALEPLKVNNTLYRRNCNILFMKEQEEADDLSYLGENITVESVILDFINYANAEKNNPSDPNKGKDIAKKYFFFNFQLK